MLASGRVICRSSSIDLHFCKKVECLAACCRPRGSSLDCGHFLRCCCRMGGLWSSLLRRYSWDLMGFLLSWMGEVCHLCPCGGSLNRIERWAELPNEIPNPRRPKPVTMVFVRNFGRNCRAWDWNHRIQSLGAQVGEVS